MKRKEASKHERTGITVAAAVLPLDKAILDKQCQPLIGRVSQNLTILLQVSRWAFPRWLCNLLTLQAQTQNEVWALSQMAQNQSTS